MNIKPFLVEEWMNEYENGAKYNIAETCVDSISLDQLFEMTGEDKEAFLKELCSRRLTYGHILGMPELTKGICGLYKTLSPEQVITTHGAAGANHHVFYSLVEPGDRVISVMPTYQQLYSIPESFGADIRVLELRKENGYLPDMGELRRLVVPGTKLICINNPNNPTGALMGEEMLAEIVSVARDAGAYILCDEVYRHLTQQDRWCESIVDLYEKGISVGSMSKVFSLAGLRLGWIALKDQDALKAIISHRDYNHISCGIMDEAISGIALKHCSTLLERSRNIVRANLKILDEWIKNEPRVHYVMPEAGTTALVYYDVDISSYEFCKGLYEFDRVLVTPGDCFGQPRSMRIGYAYGTESLRKGLNAISAYMDTLK